MSPAARCALVTGAGRGLGRALAEELLARGYRVIACVRDLPRVEFQAVGNCRILPLDLRSAASAAALAAEVADEPVGMVIHNAAIRGNTGGLAEFDPDEFLDVMRTNVAGPVALTRALIARLPASARIVFISSRAGSMAEGADPDGDYAYCCSKAALNRAMVKLCDDYPHSFFALHPGWVRTDMGGPAAELDAAASARAVIDLIEASGPDERASFRGWDGARIAW